MNNSENDFETLIEKYHSKEEKNKFKIISQIAKIEDSRVSDFLIDVLLDQDEHIEVRIYASGYLKDKVQPKLKRLLDGLINPNETIRKICANLLIIRNWIPKSKFEYYIHLLALKKWYILREKEEESLQFLTKIASNKNDSVRYMAIEGLGSFYNNKDVVPLLITALEDESYKVRHIAAWMLEKFEDERALLPFIKSLGDIDYRVRKYSAKGLGFIGKKEVIKPLFKCLSDMVPSVRYSVLKALKRLDWKPENAEESQVVEKNKGNYDFYLGKEGADDEIIHIIKTGEYHEREKALELGKYGKMQEINPIQFFEEIEGISEFEQAENLEESIEKTVDVKEIDNKVNEAYKKIEYWSPDRESKLESIVDAFKKQDYSKIIKRLIDDLFIVDIPNYSTVGLSATLLGLMGEKEAIEPLLDQLHDYYSYGRFQAVVALGELGAEEALFSIIHQLDESYIWEEYVEVIQTLMKFSDKKIIRILLEAVEEDEDGYLDEEVVEVLKAMGPEVVAEIEKYMTSDSSVIQSCVCEVLLEFCNEDYDTVYYIATQTKDYYVKSKGIRALSKFDREEVQELVKKIIREYCDNPKEMNEDLILEAAIAIGLYGDKDSFLKASIAAGIAEERRNYELFNVLDRSVQKIHKRLKGEVDDSIDPLADPLTITITEVQEDLLKSLVDELLAKVDRRRLEILSEDINRIATHQGSYALWDFIWKRRNIVEQILPIILQIIEHPNNYYKEIGIEILQRMVNQKGLETDYSVAIPFVLKLLENKKKIIRQKAIWTLNVIGNKTIIEPLLGRLETEKELKSHIIEVLGNFGAFADGYIDLLWEVMVEPLDEDNLSKEEAQEIKNSKFQASQELLKLPKPPIEEVIEYLKTSERSYSKEYLVKNIWEIDNPKILDVILVALNDKEPRVRIAALESVSRIDYRSPELKEKILGILISEKDSKVRRTCAYSTSKFNDKEIIDAIISTFSEVDDFVKSGYLYHISMSEDPRAPELILNELNTDNSLPILENALYGIRRLKHKSSIKKLKALLSKIEDNEIKRLYDFKHNIRKTIEELEKVQ